MLHRDFYRETGFEPVISYGLSIGAPSPMHVSSRPVKTCIWGSLQLAGNATGIRLKWWNRDARDARHRSPFLVITPSAAPVPDPPAEARHAGTMQASVSTGLTIADTSRSENSVQSNVRPFPRPSAPPPPAGETEARDASEKAAKH